MSEIEEGRILGGLKAIRGGGSRSELLGMNEAKSGVEGAARDRILVELEIAWRVLEEEREVLATLQSVRRYLDLVARAREAGIFPR